MATIERRREVFDATGSSCVFCGIVWYLNGPLVFVVPSSRKLEIAVQISALVIFYNVIELAFVVGKSAKVRDRQAGDQACLL